MTRSEGGSVVPRPTVFVKDEQDRIEVSIPAQFEVVPPMPARTNPR